MKRIFQIALKDLRLVSRDKLGMFFILGFPILMALFFGSVMGGGGSSSGQLTVAITDEDQSEMSAAFVAALKKNENVNVIELARVEAANRVRRGKLSAMLVVPSGFGETAGIIWKEPPAILVGVDPSRKATAGMLQGYVMQATGELMSTRFSDPSTMKTLVDEQQEQIAAATNLSPTMKPLLTTMMGTLDSFFDQLDQVQKGDQAGGNGDDNGEAAGFNMQLAKLESISIAEESDPNVQLPVSKRIRSSWDISFPQAMLWGVLSCVAGFAISIAQERTQGTFVRLQVAPISRSHIVFGKALGCFLALIGVITILIALGTSLGMRPGRWDLLALAVVSTSICFVGMMMVVSLFGRTEQAVSGAVWGVNMVFAMIGGCMIPLAFLPKFMLPLSNISPVKWAILSLEGAIWRGFSFVEMLMPCGILLSIGTIGLLAGARQLSRG